MKVETSERDIRKRAMTLYSGDSSPISREKSGELPLMIDWWANHPQEESSNTPRQQAAMILYTELGRKTKPPIEFGFPGRFDCDAGISLRPDKAVIKTFLKDGLVTHRMLGWQLVFDLTDAGKSYLEAATSTILTPFQLGIDAL